MKIRDLMIAVSAVTLALGLAGCGKSEDASKAAGGASASIAPVASVSVAAPASDVPAASAATDAAPAANATATTVASADASNADGEKVFRSVCFMCHQTGAAGAPILGNKSDWAPRIAAGKPTLYRHALEGFTGNNGTMPPRGGSPSLKDADVKAAVDFMVSKVQ